MLGRILLYAGFALVILGLLGLGSCIRKAIRIRKGEMEGDEANAALNRLVAMNMASVGTASLGLALVVVGLLF